ncbi:MAG: hypothetical protein K2N78_10970 [Oscillospiraceae bacterium]|nr:hypothetical protein [Oscillospiraceae bacterium]
MKITITYIPSEVREADYILRFIRSVLPGAKVRRSSAHPPQICVYLTTKKVLDHNTPDVV